MVARGFRVDLAMCGIVGVVGNWYSGLDIRSRRLSGVWRRFLLTAAGSWLRRPLRYGVAELLSIGTLRRLGYLDPAPVLRTWRQHIAGRQLESLSVGYLDIPGMA